MSVINRFALIATALLTVVAPSTVMNNQPLEPVQQPGTYICKIWPKMPMCNGR
ncbi:hypothetical protein ACTQ49_10045 [Luteococcus sp. Sow4_B9]|uniref:hypothetical protein n=1 Tax=Luteococcus sp. Sow4_B9 TaxID=3438792 RepID=UPI003F9631A7